MDQSKALNYLNGPMVIISASGMADAGRVKHHISNNIENSRNTIVFTGYCEPHSLGGRLMAGQQEGKHFWRPAPGECRDRIHQKYECAWRL
ncbi:MAG: hypothetical protein NVV59_12605 [Chitinophagaceae bacterium]|nr:hypothetical protein [Chitinophagaceae bacterium]